MSSLDGISLLLVDGDIKFLDGTRQALTELLPDIKTRCATSYVEAKKILESVTPDVIVSEYRLPDGNGLDILEMIRRSGQRVSFIILTAYSRKDIVTRALDLGARCFIKKEKDVKRVYEQLKYVIKNSIEDILKNKVLTSSERRYRMTLDAISDAIHIVRPDLTIVTVNKSLEEWLKRLNIDTDVINKHVMEAFPFLSQTVLDEYHNVLRSGQPLVTKESTRLGDKLIWTDTRKFPILEDSRVTQIVTILRNITEQVETERELMQREQWFRGIFEDSLVPIAVIDNTGRLVDANRAFVEFAGVPSAEVLRKLSLFDYPILKESTKSQFHAGNRIITDGIVDYDMLREHGLSTMTKSGIAHVRAVFSPLKYNGQLQGYILHVFDITELKRQKEELSEFAHDVAHDLRSAMQNIQGYISLMEMDNNLKHLTDVIRIIDRMNEILSRSIKLADAGLVIGESENVDLNKLVQEVAQRILNHTIQLELGQLPTVKCDRSRIEQVFENLLINAVEHGHPTIVSIESIAATDVTQVLIKNNGTPIPSNIWPQLFIRRISSKSGGGGLGLAIVKKIVEAHGWSISLDPDKEVTTFRIKIPSHSIVNAEMTQ